VNLSSSASWRLPFALQAFIAFAFTISTLILLPESPRWLSARGRHDEALKIWEELGIAATEREKIEENQNTLENAGNKGTGRELLEVFSKDAWRRTGLGVFLMGMQQASGIDGVLYYAPLLFSSAGLSSSTAAFLASGISALLILLVTLPAFLFADRWGRSTSAIFGGLVQTFCMFLMGSLYAARAVHSDRGAARWVVIVCIYIFAMVFSGTWGVCFRVYVSEIQPPRTRAGASSLALSANWMVNWIIAFTTPIFLAKSSYGVYFLFGSAALLTVVVCALWMPETKGRSLEDIDESFRRGHKKAHARDETIELRDMASGGIFIEGVDGEGVFESERGSRKEFRVEARDMATSSSSVI
jgi:sugar porter (SP) family MFS transporter